MKPKKLERIIKLLRDNHVSHLKTAEIEITLEQSKQPFVAIGPVIKPVEKGPPSDAAIPPVENTIPHHENEVKKLLSLSDEELIDKIFPVEPQPGQELANA